MQGINKDEIFLKASQETRMDIVGLIQKDFKTMDFEFFDSFLYEINKKNYYFGDHFKESLKRLNFKNYFKRYVKGFLQIPKNLNKKGDLIFSNAYHGLNDLLRKNNLNVITPPWQSFTGKKSFSFFHALNSFSYYQIDKFNLKDLFIENFYQNYKLMEKKIDNFLNDLNNYRFIFPNDMAFFENIFLKKAKKSKRHKGFVFIHGFPAATIYPDHLRGNGLFVWGPQIRKNLIHSGYPSEQIHVVGHPSYSSGAFPKISSLSMDLSQILVLTLSCNGGQYGHGKPLWQNRAMSLGYLYQIKKVLKLCGIDSCILRPHPGENPNWYIENLGNDFFKIDRNHSIQNSLKKCSLVIGPTSSVFFDSQFASKPYLIFEPLEDSNRNLLGFPLYPPFDGSFEDIPMAKNSEELLKILIDRKNFNITSLNSFIEEKFQLEHFKEVLYGKN